MRCRLLSVTNVIVGVAIVQADYQGEKARRRAE
jgi:hypothetical protein